MRVLLVSEGKNELLDRDGNGALARLVRTLPGSQTTWRSMKSGTYVTREPDGIRAGVIRSRERSSAGSLVQKPRDSTRSCS